MFSLRVRLVEYSTRGNAIISVFIVPLPLPVKKHVEPDDKVSAGSSSSEVEFEIFYP